MATETYFKNFNTVTYSNNSVVDITERVVVLNNIQKNPYVYYPLDLTEGSRADQIADQNYNDSYASWVLYLSNDIVDPYYEWPLTDYQFDAHIVSKYGSMEKALQKIAFWRNDWVDKPTLSVAGYLAETNNNPDRLKYWKANYNNSGKSSSYSRTTEDWITNTNQIIEYPYTTGQSGSFIKGEIVTINGNSRAQVVNSTNAKVIVNNPIDVQNISTGTMIGQQSGFQVSYTAKNILVTNISANEIVYWKPVSFYDVELEKNAGNRTIRVMNGQYVPKFIQNVKTLLSNT